MSSASRGLPGFLRRSVRSDYSEDDDDEPNEVQSISSNNSVSASSLPESQSEHNINNSNKNDNDILVSTDGDLQQRQPQSSPAILTDGSGGGHRSVSSRASMPPIKVSPKPPLTSVPLNRQVSEPRMAAHTTTASSSSKLSASSDRDDMDRSMPAPLRESDLDQQQQQQQQTKTTRRKTYKETQFEKIFSTNVVPMNDLKTLAWNGIPPEERPRAWKILLGYLPTNASRRQHTLQKKRAEYKDAIAQHYDIDDNSRTIQEQEVLRQVLVDVPRTAPTVKLFRDERIKTLLTRILYVWAMRHPASSYVQGINDLAMPLIVTYLTATQMATANNSNNTREQQEEDTTENVERIDYDAVLEGRIMESVTDDQLEEIEADCYWCLTNLLAGIQDHYTSDQPGVQRMVLRLEELVNRIDADLCAHLRDTGIEFMQFAFKWMNCLLLREFNLKCVIRLWDTYISEKDGFEDFHVYVCAAFLCQFSSQLQAMTFDELFGFMQAMPTSDWSDTEIEMLLSQAYVLSTLFGGSDAHLIANTNNGRF